ncbi:MAG: DUF6268 family outer membrane beta-barrel protein [Ferruginibacter sp.]
MKKNKLIKKANSLLFVLFIMSACLFFSSESKAQPFLDIINLKYTNSPNTGFINQNKNDLRLHLLGAGTNLPIQFKNKKDAVIFSPFYEQWSSQINNNKKQNYYSVGLPVTLSKTIPHSKWNFLLTAIVRMNDSSIDKKTKAQGGGAFIVGYKKSGKLTYKLGLYINNELFGVFVIPLLGIDWNITPRDNLFGILPGNLTYEHKLNNHFYYGAAFRAITNSYGMGNGYWRIDENQLGLYLDSYLNKNIVLNVEAGHSILRKIRTGIKHVSKYDADVNDNLYIKIALAYRVRFKK